MIYCQCGDDSTPVSAGVHTLEFAPGYLDLHSSLYPLLADPIMNFNEILRTP